MPSLVLHPDALSGAIHAIDAELERLGGGAMATFRVHGDMAKLVIPPPAPATRTDGLWRTTCFELFVGGEGEEYREFNFSPSGAWAAYEFEGYRAGMRHAAAQVETETSLTNNELHFSAKVRTELPDPANVGLAVVIEETDGSISYWSTAFAPGKPDFHTAAVRSLLLDGVSAE